MKRPRLLVAATGVAALVAACGGAGDGAGSQAPKTYPADCAGLGASDTVDCAEQRYWDAELRAVDQREATYAQLGVLLDRRAGESDPGTGRLFFLRGTLAMTLALENGRGDLITKIRPDLAQAVAMDPSNGKYPPWVDSMDLVLTFLANDQTGFAAAAKASVDHVALYPTGNILSIAGTMAGFPLDTGLPQKAVELLETWKCDQDWCMHNTSKAPFSQPGLQYFFGDAYARVGDRARALAAFQAALSAEGADRWPYRDLAEAAARDVDGFVEKYTALGQDKPAISLVSANAKYGCSLCHTDVRPANR